MTISLAAWLDGESLPPVHHSQVVKHSQVSWTQLVLQTEVLVVAKSIEQLQSQVDFFGGIFRLESLGASDLVVEADLLDVASLVQLYSGPAEPLVKCRHLVSVLV